jgi:tRNA G26 N,N-dimethylase Trm1
MIDTRAVQEAMKSGMAFVCAMCDHFHHAQSIAPGSGCGQECGGPTRRMLFPKYKGPMGEDALVSHCLRCGEPADAGAVGHVTGRKLGFCEKHRDWLNGVLSVDAKHVHLPILTP